MQATRGLLFAAVLLSAWPARAGQPRLVVADLHGQAELKEIGVATSVLTAASLGRSGALEVVPRDEIIRTVTTMRLPARDGLWLGPTEAKAVCEATRCTQLLTGTLSGDAVNVHVTLRLLQHDGSVAKTVRLDHPLRQIPMLPMAVAAKARALLGVDAPPPPAARQATLTALGAAWIAAQKKDIDLTVIQAELAAEPSSIALKFAQPAADLVGYVKATAESPTAKLRVLAAVDPQAAIKDTEALAEGNAANTGARFLYAKTLLEAGKAKEALNALAPREGEADIAEAHLLRGRAYLLLKQVPKAQDELKKAVELDASNPESHYFYGEALARAKDARAGEEYQAAADALHRKGDGRAIDAFLRAMQIDARLLVVDLDALDLTPEDVKLARKTASEAGAKAPGDPKLAALRAAIAAAAGDKAEAQKELGEARLEGPASAALSRVKARVAAEQGDHKAALAAFEAAYAVRPSPPLALDTAREAALAGDLDKARAYYTKAAASPQLEVVVARELGEIELRKGDPQSAAELLRKAAQAQPDDAEVHLKLAKALVQTGDTAGADAARLTAASLDPDIAVDRGELARPGEPRKPTATATQTGGPSDGPAPDLMNQLPALLRSFPPLKEHGEGGTVALVHAPLPLARQLLPVHKINYAAVDRALLALLGPQGAVPFDKVVPPVTAGEAEGTDTALQQVAERTGADIVVQWGGSADSGGLDMTMLAFDRRTRKVYTNGALLHAPIAVGPIQLLPIEIIVVTLLAIVGFFVLRPRGALTVKIEYDPSMDAGLFSLRIYKIRRGGMGLKGGSEQSYVDAVRRKGATVSSRGANMVGKETTFKLPAGKWWVYLFGVYVKNGKPQGNFLNEKRVTVPRGKTEIAEFNLIPKETSVLVKVVSGGEPVFGAAVWLNADEHKAVYTNKMAGGALILAPRGSHIITVRHQGKQVDQNLGVTSPFPMEVVVDITHAEVMAQEVTTGRKVHDASAIAATNAMNMHESLQGNMFDLDSAPALGEGAPSSTAVANAQRYELKTELGRGAMGVVYEAWDTVLERSVALKVISQELKNRPDVVELFMREARSLAQLNHPNIVTVFDFGQRGVDYFMALELVHGRTLEQMLSELGGPVPLGQALDIAIEVSAGLGYAHERRVIHRDIKPANIFLTEDGRVKIMDFGLARVVRELSIKRTMISGTPLYMSPEQIRGTDLDFRADLYSLGCMIYEMVCGTPPFYEGEILYHHSHTRPDAPSSRLPSLPAELDAVVLRCLEKDKEARYASVAELAGALKELRGRLSARASAASSKL